MASIVRSIGILGLDGYVIDVEVSVYNGLAMTTIVGLGDAAVKEARDRIETCFFQMDLIYPMKKIVINLSPSDVKKSGTHFDLAMMVGIMLESDQIKPYDFAIDEYIFLGEISLTGELKSFQGVLPMIIAAKNRGYKKVIIPTLCFKEATLVEGMQIYPFDHIKKVKLFIETKMERKPAEAKKEDHLPEQFHVDFADVSGHHDVMEYVIAAAAGNHNLLLIGAPGCGKSMIAKRMPTILPDMIMEEVLEVTSIYSICGLLKEHQLIKTRPFRSPHYNASSNALIGGGINAMPGEISLAHNGILFLDELPEFSRSTLESLRQPLEDRIVTISRVKQTNVFPANFQLVAAMNPCPCGNHGSSLCLCTAHDIKRYTQRISGPILDRIDIQKYLGKVNPLVTNTQKTNKCSKEIKERVQHVRKIQWTRFLNVPGINSNAQMEVAHIKEFCSLTVESLDLLQKSYEKFQFSARTYNKIIKIARTFADMDFSKDIQKKHMISGLMSRDLDKDKKTMVVNE